MPSVPRVLGGLGDCLPWAYGTSGVRPHNGVERSGKALRRLAFGALAGASDGVLPQSTWIRVKAIGRFWSRDAAARISGGGPFGVAREVYSRRPFLEKRTCSVTIWHIRFLLRHYASHP